MLASLSRSSTPPWYILLYTLMIIFRGVVTSRFLRSSRHSPVTGFILQNKPIGSTPVYAPQKDGYDNTNTVLLHICWPCSKPMTQKQRCCRQRFELAKKCSVLVIDYTHNYANFRIN